MAGSGRVGTRCSVGGIMAPPWPAAAAAALCFFGAGAPPPISPVLFVLGHEDGGPLVLTTLHHSAHLWFVVARQAVSLATHIIATCNSVFRKLRKTRKQIRKKTEKEGKAGTLPQRIECISSLVSRWAGLALASGWESCVRACVRGG